MSVGDFLWYELVTRDAAKAQAFYARLFGWKFQEMSMGDFVYRVISLDGTQQGGMGGIMEEKNLPAEVPPHWLSYLSVANVDATFNIATGLGATAIVPPKDIGQNMGRLSVLRDPQGAVFALHQAPPNAPPMPPFKAKVHGFVWTELMTKDAEAAKKFYAAIAGWSYAPMDMGPQGAYWVAKLGETQIAGLMNIPPDGPPTPAWLPYVAVAKVDETAAVAAKLGAHVAVLPTEVPKVGRFAVLIDPTGAALAIITMAGM